MLEREKAQFAYAEQQKLRKEREKNGESLLKEAPAEENREKTALKELYDDPRYEEQKAFWPKSEPHFKHHSDLFLRIIEEREAR